MPDFLTIKIEIMKRKKIIFTIVAIAIICGGLYGFSEYNRKVKDLSKVKEQVQVNAEELVAMFLKSETEANALYLGKIVAVKGIVKKVERDDMGYYAVILGEGENKSSVRCSMDSSHHQDIADLPAGSRITIKGSCTGFNEDELLGSDVILNRCVVHK